MDLERSMTGRSGVSINIANGNDFPIETLEDAVISPRSQADSPRHRFHTTRLSTILDAVRGNISSTDEDRPSTARSAASHARSAIQPASPSQSVETSVASPEKEAAALEEATEDAWHLHHCDRRLLAPLFVMALLHGFDKNVSHAKTMGMDTQLGISAVQWSVLLTTCYIGFIISTVVVVLYVRVQGRSLLAILSGLTVAMGSLTTLMALAAQIEQAWLWIATVRFLQGIFEAGFNAMMATYLLQFYTASQLAPRMFLFFLAPAGAACLGAGFAFAMFQIRGAALKNWQAFYIAEGLLTVGCGVASWFWLPSDWEHASWHRQNLTEEEKRNAVEENGLGSPCQRTPTLQLIGEGYDWSQLRCLVRSNPGRFWMLLDISLGVSTALVLLYMPQLIEKLDFDASLANLLTMIPYIAAMLVLWLSLRVVPSSDQNRAILVVCIFASQAVGFFIYFLVIRQSDTLTVTSSGLTRQVDAAGHDLAIGLKVLGFLSLLLAASGVGTSNVLAAKLYGLRIENHALRLVINTIGVALINLAGTVASWAPMTGKTEVFGFSFAAFGLLVSTCSLGLDFLQRRRNNDKDKAETNNV